MRADHQLVTAFHLSLKVPLLVFLAVSLLHSPSEQHPKKLLLSHILIKMWLNRSFFGCCSDGLCSRETARKTRSGTLRLRWKAVTNWWSARILRIYSGGDWLNALASFQV